MLEMPWNGPLERGVFVVGFGLGATSAAEWPPQEHRGVSSQSDSGCTALKARARALQLPQQQQKQRVQQQKQQQQQQQQQQEQEQQQH